MDYYKVEDLSHIEVYSDEEDDIKGSGYIKNNPFMPETLARWGIFGPSGCGKTQLFFNIIMKNWIEWDRIMIFARKLNSPHNRHYKTIKKFVTDYCIDNNIHIEDKMIMSTTLDDLPEIDDGEKYKYIDSKTIVVFDDFLTLTKNEASKISKYFEYGRHNNMFIFWLAQSFFKSHPSIRSNCNVYSIFRMNRREFNSATLNIPIDDDQREFIKKNFTKITKKKYDFLHIDLTHKDEKYQIRKNLDTLLKIE